MIETLIIIALSLATLIVIGATIADSDTTYNDD